MPNILYIGTTVTCANGLHFVPAILPLNIRHPRDFEWPHVSVEFTSKGFEQLTIRRKLQTNLFKAWAWVNNMNGR